MKKIGTTVIKSIGFFLGWTILVSILPLSSSKEQAIWRLWAEITPLLAIVAFTLGFWLADDYPNLVVTTFTGNDILSGGICKIEGSIIVLIVNVVLIALFIFLQKKRIKA